MKTALQASFLVFSVVALALPVSGQDHSVMNLPPGTILGIDMLDTRNFTLLDYKRMFSNAPTPDATELYGTWRGVNKGVATLAGFKQFVKEIEPADCATFGINVQVHQVSAECLRCLGWQPKIDADGMVEKRGKFKVKSIDSRNRFQRDAANELIFSYREGGNPPFDASKLLVDKVVKIDDNHMLGRASAKFGMVRIPIAFFMLERVNRRFVHH